jgi:hypothetical protein
VGSAAFDGAVFRPAQATIAQATFRQLALMEAQKATEAATGAWGRLRQAVSSATVIMCSLDLRPNQPEMVTNTTPTKTDHSGDGPSRRATLSTCWHDALLGRRSYDAAFGETFL